MKCCSTLWRIRFLGTAEFIIEREFELVKLHNRELFHRHKQSGVLCLNTVVHNPVHSLIFPCSSPFLILN